MVAKAQTESDIAAMRAAGKAAASVLEMIEEHVRPGVTTEQLNQLSHDFIVTTLGCIPAPLNYRSGPNTPPFPKSICTSVNHVICHGIPTDKKALKSGDIVNIDVTVIKDGFHGDTSKMFFVGEPSVMASRLVRVTQECLYRGIESVRPGSFLGDIGNAIETHATRNRFSVVQEFCGHGIGRIFHDTPQILHYGRAGTGMRLEEGMTFTIEPMINAGSRHLRILPDAWTVVTKDHKLSAQWEHTILVTGRGVEVLTARDEESLADAGAMLTVTVAQARGLIEANTASLAERYWQRADVVDLLGSRTGLFDELLTRFFIQHFGPAPIALIAVGGFGRSELFPGSDIDICLLVEDPDTWRSQIEAFMRDLFDLNVEIGYSVRSLSDCATQASTDITIATALFERRLLAGDAALAARLEAELSQQHVWPGDEFFRAKRDEQEHRHERFDNVDYGLEPNLKSSPGGLRDYQTVMWVCLRQFGTASPEALVELGVLTAEEKDWLLEGRRFLWWVRFGLHLLAGRKEDRLQFQLQRELARRLGFADTRAQLGVERFMHLYYRHVLALREVNDILLQDFEERIIDPAAEPVMEPVNERFQLRNSYIETTHAAVFSEHPSAMMELFVIMANRRDIAGVRASTIRLIREHLHLVNDEFRNDPAVTGLFISLLKAPHTLVSQLTRMRRYGLLGRYIPEFGRVIGQMQHDLFHIYTVDAHTMMVIRNMRRFFYRSSQTTFPVAAHCVHQLPKIELLYIAGLYHDIAKGRGGDHSELGANDVRAFCQRHQLPEADTDLVCWLVEKHLYMSSVAQRQDIYDPEVVHAFASEVKSARRLDYLYLLTVADINATNPTLWNSYRATLLRHLYGATRRALRRGLESPMDKAATIEACRESALSKLAKSHPEFTQQQILDFWRTPNEEFFLKHSARQIAKLTVACITHDPDAGPLVMLHNTQAQVEDEAVTELYIYTRDRAGLFGTTTAALDQLNLSVYEASINTAEHGLCFNNFVVLNDEHAAVPVREHASVAARISQILMAANPRGLAPKRLPRQLKQLSRRSECTLYTNPGNNYSTLTVTALDRPGLLAEIGALFQDFNVSVLRARIATLGERAEDLFDIQTAAGTAYDAAAAYELSQTIRQALDWHLQKAL